MSTDNHIYANTKRPHTKSLEMVVPTTLSANCKGGEKEGFAAHTTEEEVQTAET